MIIKWGHFSDLHFQGWDGFKTSDLRLKLPEALEEDNIELHYIFITGDIFHQGDFDDKTKDFIEEIASLTKCKKENIIICPGNHDGIRNRARKRLLDDFISMREGDRSAQIDDSYRYTLIDDPFKKFAETHEEITGSEPESLLGYTRKLDGINLYVLNTSVFAGQTYPRKEEWSSEEKARDDHNLYLQDSNLAEMRESAREKGFTDNNNLNVVIGHHGVECFVEEEQDNLKNFFRAQKIDLYLCGHVHRSSNDEISGSTDARQVSCGGLFYNDHAEASFIYGELDTDTREVKLHNYFYDKKPQWAINSAAPDPYKHGIHQYKPPRNDREPLTVAVSVKLAGSDLYDFAGKQYEQANDSPSKGIIRSVKKDIEKVTCDFCGYEAELKKLKSLMMNDRYVYIHGQQLFGKTSLIRKAIYDISTQDTFSADFSAHPVPWIHKCLVVIGKNVSSKDRGMEVLIEQANMLLAEPVKTKENGYDKYDFSSIMRKLSKKLDHVTVIFDALDEMGMDDLELFTEPLPDNCTVVLSSKQKSSVVKKRIENIKSIELRGFDEKDILKILNRKKSERNVTGFVKYLMDKTKGNPCFILDIAEKIKENNNEIPVNYRDAYKYIASLDSFFANFREFWLKDPRLKELLKLFTIFERIDYLTIEDMQSYLIFIGNQIDSDSVEQLLNPVISQLDTNDDGKYKIKYNAFVGYLIKKYTAADFEMAFCNVVSWLINKKDYIDLGSLFLSWNVEKEIDEEKAKIIARESDKILDILIENKIIVNSNITEVMCTVARQDDGMKERFHPYIIKSLDTLENKDYYDAVSDYFTHLYNTSGNGEGKKETANYIKNLADQGNKSAALSYAELIQFGDIYTARDIDQAIHYLKMVGENRKSVVRLYDIYNEKRRTGAEYVDGLTEHLDKLKEYDDDEAQIIYAVHSAQGHIYEKNVIKSCEILDRLIDKKSPGAMINKAKIISNGLLDNYGIEDALDLWDQAAKLDTRGYLRKGQYLYNNGEPEEGYELIRQAYEKGNAEAALFIAEDNLDKNRGFNADLVSRLNEIVATLCEENREAAALIYRGVQCHLIKKYSGYNLDDLYYFAYDALDANWFIGKAYQYYLNSNYNNAFSCFETAYNNGHLGASVNMAYMLRKSEAKSDKYTVEELLAPLVNENNTLAVVNYILEIIKHSDSQETFDEALNLLRKIDTAEKDYSSAVDWWTNLSDQKNDPEGDLVLGLLMYVGKMDSGAKNEDMQNRLQTASEAGYAIADYVLTKI